ncbi:hypothetical protein ACVWYH_006474 [Bradyrhizobium sp. GM24.11]
MIYDQGAIDIYDQGAIDVQIMLRIDSFRAGVQVARDVDVSEANILHFAGPSMIAVVNHPKAIAAAPPMLPVRVDEARPKGGTQLLSLVPSANR